MSTYKSYLEEKAEQAQNILVAGMILFLAFQLIAAIFRALKWPCHNRIAKKLFKYYAIVLVSVRAWSRSSRLGDSKRLSTWSSRKSCKPYLHVWQQSFPDSIIHFLNRHYVNVLNVVGKCESSAPGIGALVKRFLAAAFNIGQKNS